ncbi:MULTISPECIES: DUF1800 domain-containing protein [unclassified Tolypothrix]|uniref:DUF1800 domain-containing protein n=1 Tax=unclassified Tolypothrix TaxID=2649714 RepID=UPI0005EAB5FE|nr:MULTISPECIES: DUF1800 domain-containing protein [unclassified Tolypothrix]BAY88984.1 hypothetical protein NIES3275_09860 [Microchaete diplosiphon NIES-3275]EKF06127.1 hypothetical protein FDUTEX481_00063 [Tolypothrix sp. PCC 7601]MBE9080753.1 DUF1800 domain-containing protein [Tolypothrix sp. LEGE 11397]UYD29619.1 DUF1800 domain-containing protein [Tolypothrix sp. PCC 7712]UYD34466.1 DUF1800 domain-containing protein [Tolypothrix sp. PCC 7601]
MTAKPRFFVMSLLILLVGVTPSNAAPQSVDPKVLHIINRLSFGPRPGDVQRVESIGVERYIKEQLSPESIPESSSLENQLAQLKTLSLKPMQLLADGVTTPKSSPEIKKAAQQKARGVLQEAIQARLLRATNSPRQLQEVMVDFWYNHFNVDAAKGRTRLLVGAYEQQAIRPYALGRFRDLLGATAHHPAMLYYLDNWQNTAPHSPGARGRFQGLNENYARELMELHTLGVDGGYTQQDVIALAKILTGWGIARPNQQNSHSFGFYFDPKRHDSSDKVFLKTTIKGGGEAEGEQALDILARSPATARHLSYELAQYFVSDRPPTTLVDRLTQRYLATDGNIRDVLDTLFHSSEFWDSKNFNAKFKTPYQYAISAVRATGVEVNNTKPIFNLLQQLDMPVYGCPTPDGYKNTETAWLNPDAMTRRLNFATAIASGRLPLSSLPTPINVGNNVSGVTLPVAKVKPSPIDSLQLTSTLGNSLSPQTQSAIASSPRQLHAALILGSPEFMRR